VSGKDKDNRPKKNFGGNSGENQKAAKGNKKGNTGGTKQTGKKPE
jgi:hypothetical protein